MDKPPHLCKWRQCLKPAFFLMDSRGQGKFWMLKSLWENDPLRLCSIVGLPVSSFPFPFPPFLTSSSRLQNRTQTSGLRHSSHVHHLYTDYGLSSLSYSWFALTALRGSFVFRESLLSLDYLPRAKQMTQKIILSGSDGDQDWSLLCSA